MWTLNISEKLNKESLKKAQSAFSKLFANETIGFKNISRMDEAITAVQEQTSSLKQFEKIVVVGVGGSSLGTRAVCEALYPGEWKKKLHFLDNVDGFSIDKFLQEMTQPEKSLWVLCSKSGSTIEVLSLYEYCYNAIKEKNNFDIKKNTVAVTETKDSAIYKFTQDNNITQLDMPKDVGGRFSIFTAIGLLPLYFLDFDMSKARKGVEKALESKSMICELSAFLYIQQIKANQNFYSFQYCDRLSKWSLWLQQLWSESLAKKITRQGESAPIISAFIPCRGVSAQHSVLQQIIEGCGSKFVGFYRVRGSEKSRYSINEKIFSDSLMENKGLGELLGVELESTELAIQESGTTTFTFTADKLNEESISFIMMIWMLSIGVLGEMFDINAFNQPGVESGKTIARQRLSEG